MSFQDEVTKIEEEVQAKVDQVKPIVQGWLAKLEAEGHILVEELKAKEQELVAYVEGLFAKKSQPVVVETPTATEAPASAVETAPASDTTPTGS